VDEQSDPKDLTGNYTSIDDGDFGVFTAAGTIWPNTPATRHGNGGAVSFADGRSEQWRWREPTTARARASWLQVPRRWTGISCGLRQPAMRPVRTGD